jgi:dTDP-N-acetylfucosamine:lipid II N-acetylfucosaminyltransferase
LKITHIGPDSQFVRFAAEVFESVAPGANEHIILTDSGEGPLRFPIHQGRVRIVSSHARGTFRIPFAVRSSDMIIAHSMTPHAAIAFETARPGPVRVWSGWGFDYYGSADSPDTGLLGESTLELSTALRIAASRRKSIASVVAPLGLETFRRVVNHAAAKTDYFSAPIPDDFVVFKNRFPEFAGVYSQLSYGSVDDTFAGSAGLATGNDILIGNSASAANNHLEIFDLLSHMDLSGRRIVVPLSYGNPAYRDVIVDRGVALFGSAFRPLVDFLPFREYASVVANCNVVVMNHKRQQGIGNIGSSLYHGAHVFLDETNPTLNFFRSRGAFVSTTSQLEVGGLPSAALTVEAVETNRRVLEDFWGTEQVVNNVEALVSRLNR